MTLANWITVLGTALITALPVIVPCIPPPYNAMVVLLAGTLANLLHLHMVSPNDRNRGIGGTLP